VNGYLSDATALFSDVEPPTDFRVAVAYQYYDDYQLGREEQTKKMLVEDLHGIGHKSVELIKQDSFEYFPRFNQDQVNRFFPWKILDMQGVNKTWYAGSSVCFESVEDVVCYNHLLFKLDLQIPNA